MTGRTHQRTSCEGHIYITVNRKDGKFENILISPPAKTNDCGGSWAYAVQDLLTFTLRRADVEKDLKVILKALSGHICNAMPPNRRHCKSCVDSVASVLKEEFSEVLAKDV